MSALREIALAVGAAAIFGGGIIAGFGWEPPTAMFPTVIGAAGLGLAVWAIVADLAKGRGKSPEDAPLSPEDRARTRSSFIWITTFFAAVLLIGFEGGISLAALAFYRLEARLSWVVSVLASLACGGFLYGAAHFLNIPLYDGVILDLVR